MELVRAGSLGEAFAARSARPGATLLAGGTDLMVDVNLNGFRPDTVITLRRVAELTERSRDYLGAGVTYADLTTSHDRALVELSRTVGSPQIRNVGTIGGNLGTASPAGDTLPFLAAIDAVVVLGSEAGTRRVPWDLFLTGPKETALGQDEIILGVELPSDRPIRQAFSKVGVRQAMVIATVSCCVVRGEDGDTRVALGAVGPTVLRAHQAEVMISHEAAPSEAALAEFSRLVSAEALPITDHRSTAEYRRHAVGVISRRALERCLAR